MSGITVLVPLNTPTGTPSTTDTSATTGSLYKSRMPLSSHALGKFLSEVTIKKISKVFLLCEDKELVQDGNNIKLKYEEKQITVVRFPIVENHIPEKQPFSALIQQIEKDLEEGKNILVQCKLGQGRTAMVIIAIAQRRFKLPVQEAEEWAKKNVDQEFKLHGVQHEFLKLFDPQKAVVMPWHDDLLMRRNLKTLEQAILKLSPQEKLPLKFVVRVNETTGEIQCSEKSSDDCSSYVIEISADKKIRVIPHQSQGVELTSISSLSALAKHLKTTPSVQTAFDNTLSAILEYEYIKYIQNYSGKLENTTEVCVTFPNQPPVKTQANKITLFNQNYIAGPHPTEKELSHFWHTIFQQNCSIIVKLSTTKVEDAVKKGFIYWPQPAKPLTVDSLTVSCLEEQTLGTNVKLRVFSLENKDKMEIVQQFDFTGWEDMQTPDPVHLLNLLNKVNAINIKSEESIFVHCTAGIGRTGTFITLRSAWGQKNPDVVETIRTLRDQRPGRRMVETLDQYQLIHQMLKFKEK